MGLSNVFEVSYDINGDLGAVITLQPSRNEDNDRISVRFFVVNMTHIDQFFSVQHWYQMVEIYDQCAFIAHKTEAIKMQLSTL